MKFNDKEEIIRLTGDWKGERFDDGRPFVPDRVLDALAKMTMEEIWKPIFLLGYENQFAGDLKLLHNDGRKLIGRAVTCTFLPSRPDLHSYLFAEGALEGRSGNYNQWVVDSLRDRDVLVCDLFDKIYKGTFLGGNLSNAVHKRTNNGGAVIWGGIRDIEQMREVPDIQVYYRGVDPTPIRDVVMTGFNTPALINRASVLPGDIVYGNEGGVLFIPAQLAESVVEDAAKTHVKDDFGFEMIAQNKFTTAQIDKNTWSVEMLDMLMEFISSDPRGEEYRSLDWSKEYRLAREGDPDDTQTAL